MPVRYNPFDLGEAFAFVRKMWVPCISEHYSVLRGKSEKELQIYGAEKRQERRKYGQELSESAKGNAIRFLASDRPTEKQALQRQRDLSALDVQQRIDESAFSVSSSQSKNSQLLIDDDCDDMSEPTPESLDEAISEIDVTSIQPYEDDALW